MPSDLQRVARGLVECLDEVPQVVAHLQRTAERCRENAALAMAASHGRATVAAQQLDAAARSCEQAAHYLSMAPPKARAWAERLVGASRSSDQPDARSADRNKATGGSGDIAERDVFGRVERLSLPFKPSEPAEGNEPPLIQVARKAFEKLRKKQQKDEEQYEEPEPIELEIVVAESGELEITEQDPPEESQYEIQVDLGPAVAELLKSMATDSRQQWSEAHITITQDRVTANYTYAKDPIAPEPPVIDIELPALVGSSRDTQQQKPVVVPELDVALDDAPDFDPAFHRGALGVEFTPGVHDPQGTFEPKELDVAKRLEKEGWRVDARLADHGSGDKNPDSMVRRSPADRGVEVEFKTLRSGNADAIKRNILDASKQIPPGGEVVIDGRHVGLEEAAALRAFRRAVGQPGRTIAGVVHCLLGDGRLVTYTKES